jgi:hypothetical protein
MPTVRRLKSSGFLAAAAVAGITGCVFRTAKIEKVDPSRTTFVATAVKAHLINGSTIVYPEGFSIEGNTVVPRSNAFRYDIGEPVPKVPGPVVLDSVVGMEAFGVKTHVAKSVVASTAGVVLGGAATVFLLKAIFGSCPTFYADSAGTELLQGEGFSYSIAPLFEQRDTDRLRLADADHGRITLRVRNEALETHYINHLELLEIQRNSDELAVGDNTGHPVAVRNLSSPRMRDRAGRDVTSIMSTLDGKVFSTDPRVIQNVKSSDLDDYIDLEVSPAARSDSVAIVLDMRNSLLNTVLLYENILGAQGAASLDFVARDLNRISSAVDLGRWYSANMGMRVSVLENGKYRQVARLGDSGPIAFHKVAVMIPAIVSSDGTVKIRLSFIADDWRIDGISVSTEWRRPTFRFVAASRVRMPDPQQDRSALSALSEADESYLITGPGQALSVEFEVGESTSSRTWLLASQGYYSEWVRGSWIKSASGKPFAPTNQTLVDAIRSWRSQQSEMEQVFYSTRIAAR